MALPTITNRVQPEGIPLHNGYQTKITFALDTNIEFWEKTVTPPGMDGHDKVEQTTMWNFVLRTYDPGALIEITDAAITVAYDPIVIDSVFQIINVVQSITVTHPDGSQEAWWGWLKSFTPSERSIDEQPEAEIVICFTGHDPDYTELFLGEVGFDLVSVPGT